MYTERSLRHTALSMGQADAMHTARACMITPERQAPRQDSEETPPSHMLKIK